MSEETVVVFNCTGEDVFVAVGGDRVLLPTLPEPRIVEHRGAVSTLTMRVGDREATVNLEGGGVDGTLFLPEPIPGFRYLVPPELLLRLPHRHDLLTPALYGDVTEPDDANGDNPDDDWLSRLCLTAVTARLDPAGPDTPNIGPEALLDDDESSVSPAEGP